MREELLVHIAKEATAVRDAGWRALKVVSDIDDTFLCSGGSFPSGDLFILFLEALHFVFLGSSFCFLRRFLCFIGP